MTTEDSSSRLILEISKLASRCLDECTMVTIEFEDSTECFTSESKSEGSVKEEISDDEEGEQEDLWYVYCDDEDADEVVSLSSVSLIVEEVDLHDDFDPFPYKEPIHENGIYSNSDLSTSMESISIDSIPFPLHTAISENEMKSNVSILPF
mmetsp:Transcript_12611/g.19399  ORF Transcript_12611/g.19399 Transcript_12611/m.19399 type:complete len:151 (-) Transcript_12611:226-678(-)